jgi:hypothetical protein
VPTIRFRLLVSVLLAATLALAAPATGSMAAPTEVTASAARAAVAGGPTAVAMKNRRCGHTLRTRYHSCVFARHVAGYYRKSTGHGFMQAQLVSAHSGRFYQVRCYGWDRIKCYTERGRITFRVSKIPRW